MLQSAVDSWRRLTTPNHVTRRRRRRCGRHEGPDDADDKQDGVSTPDTAAESPVGLWEDHLDDGNDNREFCSVPPTKTSGSNTADSLRNTPVAAAPVEEDLEHLSLPELYSILDTQIRVNIGTAVKCGICLCTLTEPTRTACGHAFCRPCILACLVSGPRPKCPECATPITKRGLQPAHDHMIALTQVYKEALQEFGFVPSTYQASFTTLTQKVVASDEDGDDDDNGNATAPQLADRLHVAATWQRQVFDNPDVSSTKLQISENHAVVEANRQACERAGYRITDQSSRSQEANDPYPAVGDSKPSARTSLPNTQEIQDDCREQQEADFELLNQQQNDEDLPPSEESRKSSSTTSSKRVSFQTKPVTSPTAKTPPSDAKLRANVDSSSPFLTRQAPSSNTVSRPASLETLLSPIDYEPSQEGISKTSVSGISEKNDEEHDDNDDETIVDIPTAVATSANIPERVNLPSDRNVISDKTQDAAKGKGVRELTKGNDKESPSLADSRQEQPSTEGIRANTEESAAASATSGDVSMKDSTLTLEQPEALAFVAENVKSDSKDVIKNERKAQVHQEKINHPGTANKPTSEGAEDMERHDNNDDDSVRRQNVTGLQEDSFGALHWQASLSPTQDQEDNSMTQDLSLTMTYDDPSMDYKQKLAQEEKVEKIRDQENENLRKEMNEDEIESSKDNEDEEQDDSQDTIPQDNLTSRAQAPTTNGGTDDSDATVEMTSESSSENNTNNRNPKEKGRKPAAISNATAAGSATSDSMARATAPRRRARSEPPPSCISKTTSIDHGDDDDDFEVGEVINVQSRTWSGINKPGGVARITCINPNGTYNVVYVLGGKENEVDSVFISRQEEKGKRKRRETAEAALPAALLQSLAAQGFDVMGTITLEEVKKAATTEETLPIGPEPHRRSKDKQKRGLRDISNQDKKPASEVKDAKTIRGKPGKKRKIKDLPECQPIPSEELQRDSTISRKKRSSGVSKKGKNEKPKGFVCEEPSGSEPTATVTNASSRKRSSSKVRDQSTSAIMAEKRAKISPRTLAPISNDEACDLADAHYKAHYESAIRAKVIHIVASGLSGKDLNMLETLVSGPSSEANVKIKLMDSFQKKATLCITPVDMDSNSGNVSVQKRTAKAMRASLAGVPIISPTWIRAFAETNSAPDLKLDFARSLPSKTKLVEESGKAKFGIARMAAALARNDVSIFHNHAVFFCGNFGSSRKDLSLLAKEAGAKILTNVAAAASHVGEGSKVAFVCHDTPKGSTIPAVLEKDIEVALQKNASDVLVVNPQWISESITCAEALPSAAFAPLNIKAKKLWKLGNPE